MIRGIAIMGLNGCGKSTLAHTIAKRLDFYAGQILYSKIRPYTRKL